MRNESMATRACGGQAKRVSVRGGFTLVEILIVVIILGILAAIVIPQFSNASTDARKASVLSQLQTFRSQIQLYKLQHNDVLPDLVLNQWTQMMSKTNVAGIVDTTATGIYGPYIESDPINPLNGNRTVAAAAGTGVGWVYSNVTTSATPGIIYATNQTDTKVFDETGATQPQVQ
jgi:general secretion pathway protein G